MNNLSLITDGFGVNSPELLLMGLESSSIIAVVVGNMPLITDGFGGNTSDVILSGLLRGSVLPTPPQTNFTVDAVWEYLIGGVQAKDILALALAQATKSRQMQTNKAIISADGLSVSIYADDGVSLLHSFTVSPDKNTRTPL